MASGGDLDLGRAITFLRGSRSQVELSRRSGISAVTLSHYETGKRAPRADNLQKLLHGLGCDRLTLEEIAWRFRRRRLLALRAREQLLRDRGAGTTPPVTPPEPAALDDETASGEPLRAATARLAQAMEDLLLAVLRHNL